MKNTPRRCASHGLKRLRRQFLYDEGCPFDEVLDTPTLAGVIREHGMPTRHRLYPPIDTLRLFVGQTLSADRACQDVVGRHLAEREANAQSPSALGTSSYCDARQRMRLALPTALSEVIAERLERAAPVHWRWQGRTVKIFDGTTVSMPDTPSNQLAYPQSRTQAVGLGFPVARIGALIGLASGAVLHHQVAPCKGKGSGEQSLLQAMLPRLNAGDVLLADALLATWWIVEGATRRGADVLMAQHGRRVTDFERGAPLGLKDHIVQWPRPPKPKEMSQQDYETCPKFITMRELEVDGRVLITTMRDQRYASPSALNTLYAMRWNIEVDFRTIKTTLQMDVLTCKSKAMVDKEIAVGILAYNLVRAALAKAASLTDVLPRALSFTGANRLVRTFSDQLRRTPEEDVGCTIASVLRSIAKLRLPNRPDRVEPRAKKRRPKNLPLLMRPRHAARDAIRSQRLNRVP